MTSGLPAGAVLMRSNQGARRPHLLESHQAPLQPPVQQMGERDFGRMPPPGQSTMPHRPSSPHGPHMSFIPSHSDRTLHRPIPEPQPRRNVDVFDIRNENITEAEARKRLSSLVVVRMERSTDPYDIDDEGNPVPPTWEKATHAVQRDISQEEARRKVRELDKETSSVTDKKNELSSAIQRQLEHAWNKLEHTESDPRFVYTLAQLDWKLKRIEGARGHDRKHDKRSKDKKRSKERHKSKRSRSRSKPRRERVSVTAYFKREPSRNENCVRMLKAQQTERREHEGRSLPASEHLPMANPGQPPLSRPVQYNPVHSLPQFQARQPAFEPQVQCRFPLNQPPNAMATYPIGSAPPPQPPLSSPPSRLLLPASEANSSQNNTSQAFEAQNRRIQPNAPRIERQATTGSRNSRGSITSFSSLSSEDSDINLTPNSSLDQGTPHHEGRRGRSRYRDHSNGGETVALEVASRQRPHNPADRFVVIPPPAPDPIKAVPEADIMKRIKQRAYREGVMDAHAMARSTTTGNMNSVRQPRIIQHRSSSQRAPEYHTTRNSSGSQDIDRLGDRFSRSSLADEPRSRPEQARDPAIHYDYREPPRRYRDDSVDEILVPRSSRSPWRRQDAQRYMANRRRTNQDAWDLGSSSPVRYGESQQRMATTNYSGYGR